MSLLRLFFPVLLAFGASGVGAAVFTVSNTGNSGPGSLRQAILDLNAASGNVHSIAFDLPTYSVITPSTVLPVISKPIVAISAGASIQIIIDGDLFNGPVLATTGSPQLLTASGLRMRNGEGALGGCLVLSDGGILTDMLFENCTAVQRGGAIHSNGQLNISDSLFISNGVSVPSAAVLNTGGGAIYKSGPGNLLVERTTFRANFVLAGASSGSVAVRGGAIWLDGPGLNHRCSDCRFLRNRAVKQRSAAAVAPSQISSGAIHMSAGALAIERSLFLGNYSDEMAGALTMGHDNGKLTISNSSFIANYGREGAGTLLVGPSAPEIVIRNTVFHDNAAGTAFPAYSGAHFAGSDNLLMTLSHTVFGRVGNAAVSNPSTLACRLYNSGFSLAGTEFSLRTSGPDNCAFMGAMASVPEGALHLGPLARHSGALVESLIPLAASELLDTGNPLAPDFGDLTRCMVRDIADTARPADGDGDGVAICDLGPLEPAEAPIFADNYDGYRINQ